jgi:hypothetical protein
VSKKCKPLKFHEGRALIIIQQTFIFAIMSPRNKIFHAISFDASYDEAKEALIAAGDAEAEEDHRLGETTLSCCNFSTLLLGLLAGFFFIQVFIVGAHLLVILLSGDDLVINSKTHTVVFSLLWKFFTAAMVIDSLRFLRNLSAITSSASAAVGRRSTDLLKEMILHTRVGIGVCLAYTTTDALLGMRAQTEFSLAILVIALVWCKIVVMCFPTDTDSEPSSSRRSMA